MQGFSALSGIFAKFTAIFALTVRAALLCMWPVAQGDRADTGIGGRFMDGTTGGRTWSRRQFLYWSASGLAGLTGCHDLWTQRSISQKVQSRSQIGEGSPYELDESVTIGSKSTVSNVEMIPVSGVGLVSNLPGTGSSAPPGGWRTMLENSLKKQGVSNVREFLDDPQRRTSLVLVSALIPPGARKGELIDVEITLPEDSKTTSLKGGYLHHCELYTYETTGNLRAMIREGRRVPPSGDLKLGDVWAVASGELVTGPFVLPRRGQKVQSGDDEGSNTDPAIVKQAWIWGGARVLRSRPYHFLLNPEDQNPRFAAVVAERLNSVFHNAADAGHKVADAKTRELIVVNVPYPYRHNHYRFLLVARQVPVLPTPVHSSYRRRLEDELLDPATALAAAIKLEALGGSSIRALRVGLESHSPWVRFAAAEALAYLGQSEGAAELARLAEQHPALRAPALKAFTALDDAAATEYLLDLMSRPDPDLRYGAFLALRLADETHPLARGIPIHRSYHLHLLAPGSPGMVHINTQRRAEIALFGDDIRLRGTFTLPIGSDYTIRVTEGGMATLTRIVKVKNEWVERQTSCEAELGAVLIALGQLGGGYAEATELIRRADAAGVLTAAVVSDAIPPELHLQHLVYFARHDPELRRADAEVARHGTVQHDLETASFQLPQPEEPANEAATLPPRPPLNREPGRLFGPKRYDHAAPPAVTVSN